MPKLRSLISAFVSSLLICEIASAKARPDRSNDHADRIGCATDYGGAISWSDHSRDELERIAHYPRTPTDNVHVHISEPRRSTSPSDDYSRQVAVRLCAMKIAFLARSDEDAIDVRQPTDLGYIVVFDDNGRLLNVSEELDMSALAKKYALYVLGLNTE